MTTFQISTKSPGEQTSNYSDPRLAVVNSLTTPTRGIILPDEFGFKNGVDSFGHPQHINIQTVSEYFRKDILALDRLMLPESNRKHNLFPFQRSIIRAAADPQIQFLWLQMLRGGSKTYTLARFALDYALQHANTPVVFTGPSFRQALLAYDNVLQIIALNNKNENASVRIAAELRGDPKRNATESILHLQNGSSIRALPMGDGSKIRGNRGGLLLIDEFYLITEEMYESHVKPFVSVQQGDQPSKIVHATTSWYQDCFAYRRLMQIASEVKAGNPAYAILDFNLLDLQTPDRLGRIFPLDPQIYKDALRHGNPLTTAMTYFNLWPTTSARWFEQQHIDAALKSTHGVRIEFKAEKKARYFAVVDLAASDEGDSTEIFVFKFEDNKAKTVWAHKEQGLGPSERAWLIHETFRQFKPEFIIYDSHAAIGKDTRKMLSEGTLIIKGEPRKITPLVHHDAYGLTGHHVLVPTAMDDAAVKKALIGPRDGTSIRGEAGFREILFSKARDLLIDGSFVGPAAPASLIDEQGELLPYSGSEQEVYDVLYEGFNQLGNIGLKRDKTNEIMTTQEGIMLFTTRPGKSMDDGAMCIVYGVIGLLKMLGVGDRKSATPLYEAIGGKAESIAEFNREYERQHVQKLVI